MNNVKYVIICSNIKRSDFYSSAYIHNNKLFDSKNEALDVALEIVNGNNGIMARVEEVK